MRVQWYFDFLSPFSYLQWAHQLGRLECAGLEFKPILFAGLLKHWGQKGPAEITAKRRFTYRHVLWLAHRYGVALRLPPAHPFNPLPLLRASIACDNRPAAIDQLFGFVWRDGHIPSEPAAFAQLCAELELDAAALADPRVKAQLRDNGSEAIDAGVFGVPSLVANGEVFWGVDSFDFLRDYLADPALLSTTAMGAADDLPDGV